ncbi:hypothetical protein [Granulicella arctica]|nr:hypothetical protein [Granulicella arctica]
MSVKPFSETITMSDIMEWTVKSNSGPRRMVPFVEVGDRLYSTYVTAI